MSELREPKAKKPRGLRKLERRALAEAEEARRFVEAQGGQEAFEAKMRAIAAQHGSHYGLPPIHPEKGFDPTQYFEREVRMQTLHVIGGAHEVEEGLLLMPGGMAKAVVNVPEKFRDAFRLNPHSTSTFARCGLQIGAFQEDIQKQLARKRLPRKMEVFLHNWAPLPFLVRRGDPVRLLNIPEIFSSPGVGLPTRPRTKISRNLTEIHAGNEVIRLNEERLPRMNLDGTELPYVDPRAPNLKQLFQSQLFERLEIKPGQFIVLATKETMQVPIGHAAFVHSARDDLHHTSAILAHPGWKGIMALEFKALRNGTIRPGDHLAHISTHALPSMPLFEYAGRYQGQTSAAPERLEPKPRNERKRLKLE